MKCYKCKEQASMSLQSAGDGSVVKLIYACKKHGEDMENQYIEEYKIRDKEGKWISIIGLVLIFLCMAVLTIGGFIILTKGI